MPTFGSDRREKEAKDFFEEHERLKQVKASQNPQPPPQAQPQAQTPAQPRPPASPAPRHEPSADPSGPSPIEALLFALRELGVDPKPVEALKGYAALLEEKEREVAQRVGELQRLLASIKKARQVLAQLGV